MKPIISVEGLGKKYTIRHEGQGRYRALREEIFKLPQRLFQRKHQSKEEFWALKDVSFDIMPGDRVGIIGRNGAGKSTLLKLLSRITEPSTGKITLRGRIASLLEVGTGFHPELTGRENIYLNGAILGMSRAEVRRKFDEIVDFSGVEKFLDTPVKRYSSGMYVRLAFAVAAHLDPEVLIVDEVLAVGDAEFQKKCLGKMEQVGKEGRSVLFVSHNMSAIQTLCSRGLFFSQGNIVYDGDIRIAINNYISFSQKGTYTDIIHKQEDAPIKLLHVSLIDRNKNKLTAIKLPTDELLFQFTVEVKEKIHEIHFGIAINSISGSRISTIHSEDGRLTFLPSELKIGINKIYCTIKNISLTPGDYYYFYGIRDSYNQAISVCSGQGILFNAYSSQSYNNISGNILAHGTWSIE